MLYSTEKEKTIAGMFPFIIASLISIGAGFFVMSMPAARRGLELLAALPISFGISLVLFSREYKYCVGSYGLSVLLATIIVRYLVTPVLIAASQSTVDTIYAREVDYQIALFIQVFELFAVLGAIKAIWPTHLRKQAFTRTSKEASFRLTWTGWIFMFMLLALLVLRGHWDNVFSHLSTWFYHEYNSEVLYTYDMMAFNILKVGAFLLIVGWMKKWYVKTKLKAFPVTIALAAGLLNTYYFNYVERTDLIILFLATFFVLATTFPDCKKIFILIFGIGGIIFGSFIFMEGTLNYSGGSSLGSVQLANYAKMAELYTTGPSTIANAHMNYESMKAEMNFMSYMKDIISSFDFLYTVPFFRFLPNMVKDAYSTVDLYVRSVGGNTYIIPNYTMSCLYVGNIFGWMLEIVFISATVKLISVCELNMIRHNDLARKYVMVNIVTMFSMGIFCNNFHLMLFAATGLPFWLLIFCYINDFGDKIRLRL